MADIEKIESNASLLILINKLTELKDFYTNINNNMIDFCSDNNINLLEDEKTLSPLIFKIKTHVSALNQEVENIKQEMNSLKPNIVKMLHMLGFTNANENESFDELFEYIKTTWFIESVPGASYSFVKNGEYYESNNKNQHNTAAVCKLTIVNSDNKTVYLDYINYAENNYDFGLVSNLNSTLTLDNTVDSNVLLNCKGTSSSSMKTLTLGAVNGYYYIKFRKDGSDNSGNDSFKFKVRFSE